MINKKSIYRMMKAHSLRAHISFIRMHTDIWVSGMFEGGRQGGRTPHPFLVDQLTLSQTEGADYAPYITTPPLPNFHTFRHPLWVLHRYLLVSQEWCCAISLLHCQYFMQFLGSSKNPLACGQSKSSPSPHSSLQDLPSQSLSPQQTLVGKSHHPWTGSNK